MTDYPYLTDDNRDDFFRLAELVTNFEESVEFLPQPIGPACWIWTRKTKVAFIRDGKRTNTRITSLVYDTAYGTEPRVGRHLSTICGNPNCINPDHITDHLAGFWEDLEFLLQHEHPLQIADRLGTNHAAIQAKGKRAREYGHLKEAAIYDRYLGRVIEYYEQEADYEADPKKRAWTLAQVGQLRKALEVRVEERKAA